MTKPTRLYKVSVHAVDGESWYFAGGSDTKALLRFLNHYDHEGSSVALEWMDPDGTLDSTDDAERVYRILAGTETP